MSKTTDKVVKKTVSKARKFFFIASASAFGVLAITPVMVGAYAMGKSLISKKGSAS